MADRAPRILLVDDEQPIQTLLSFPLQRDGYEVVQASDGREALARFSEQQFDLVVLDLMLPRMDGLEVCKRLRAKGSTVPIIMLTAKSEEIDKVLGLELGADDYITKPFSMREFRSRVKAALRRAGMARQPEADDEQPIDVRGLRIDSTKRTVDAQRRQRGDHVRRVRDPHRAGALARPRLHARHAAGARVGRLGVPRPADDRRPHPAPAGEDRDRPQGARVPVHGARRRLPVPGRRGLTEHDRPAVAAQPAGGRVRADRARRVGTIYLTVTPRLEERLRDQKLDRLLADARGNVEGQHGLRRATTFRETEDVAARRARQRRGGRRERRGADPRRAQPAAPSSLVAATIDSAPDGGVSEARRERAGARGRRVPAAGHGDAGDRRRPPGGRRLPADPRRGGRWASRCSPTRSTRSRATSP